MSQWIKSDRDSYAAGRDLHLHVHNLRNIDGVDRAEAGDVVHGRMRPVFVQYLNPEVLACYGIVASAGNVHRLIQNAVVATRIAILSTDSYLVVPASYIFEVPGFGVFLEKIGELVEMGMVRYAGPISDLASYREKKMVEYRRDPNPRYAGQKFVTDLTTDFVWQPRQANTATDIAGHWVHAFAPGEQLHWVAESLNTRLAGRRRSARAALLKMPARLDGQAFIGRFISDAMPVPLTPPERARVDLFVSQKYLESYLRDLGARLVVDFHFGDLSCNVTMDDQMRIVSASRTGLTLRWLKIYDFVYRYATWADLVSVRAVPGFGIIVTKGAQAQFAIDIQRAAVSAAKSREFRDAHNLDQAIVNVLLVADKLFVQEQHFPLKDGSEEK